MAEVDLGRLAQQKAHSAEVKEFARQMVDDHSKANMQLGGLASSANIPLSSEPVPDHKALRADLDKAGGAEFDALYMRGQLVDHQKTVLLFQWELAFGQDADLQRFVADTLPDGPSALANGAKHHGQDIRTGSPGSSANHHPYRKRNLGQAELGAQPQTRANAVSPVTADRNSNRRSHSSAPLRLRRARTN